MIIPSKEHIPVILDLARLDEPLIQNALPNVHLIGKEIDLLETIRRTDKKDEMTKNLLQWHSVAINFILPLLSYSIPYFEEYNMISINDDKITLLYSTTDEIYKYGINRIIEKISDCELHLVEYISNCMKKPMHEDMFFECIDLFTSPYNKLLEDFLVEKNILSPFDYKNEKYFVSPRIYKDEKIFRTAYEILEDNRLSSITDFLQLNPGNPSNVVQQHLQADQELIDLLSQSGIVDPLKLNIRGDPKTFLFSTDNTISKHGKDYFDLVKMTLANFRYGEYYSKISRLGNVDAFLTKLLDNGVAGNASAIGTDYKNLEMAGIIRVQKIRGGFHRFWLLKRDVIESTRSILRGFIPITSNLSVGDIANIENIVTTRSKIRSDISNISKENIITAIRQIQEEII